MHAVTMHAYSPYLLLRIAIAVLRLVVLLMVVIVVVSPPAGGVTCTLLARWGGETPHRRHH